MAPVVFLLILVLISSAHSVQIIFYEPPVFSNALERPVKVTPPEATCGVTGSQRYCKSNTDIGYLKGCLETTCTLECAQQDLAENPSHHDALVELEFTSCASKTTFNDLLGDGIEKKPFQDDSHVVQFDGLDSDDCKLDLDGNSLIHIQIQKIRSFTCMFWVWPKNSIKEQ